MPAPPEPEDETDESTYYRVQVGSFRERPNADKLLYELLDQGYPAFILYEDGYYKVQVGAFKIPRQCHSHGTAAPESRLLHIYYHLTASLRDRPGAYGSARAGFVHFSKTGFTSPYFCDTLTANNFSWRFCLWGLFY